MAGEITSISAAGPTTRHSDRAQAASGTSLFNKRSEAAWLSVPTQCFVCLTIHYEWKVLRKLSLLWAMITACVCAGIRVLFCLSWIDALRSLPSMSAKEIVRWVLKWKSTDNDHDILSFFRAFHICMWCNTLKQLTVCHRASPSVFLSATTTIVMRRQTELISEPGLVVFGCCLRQTDNCSLCVKILLILQIARFC